jgi:hypothetical protein
MKLKELVDRPAVRLFEDGISELVFGLLVVVYLTAFWALNRLPRSWRDFVGFSGPILLLGMGFGVRWLLPKLRQTIVFPRIGYAALQENAGTVTRRRLLIFMVAALAAVFWIIPVIPDYPHKTAVMLCVLFSGLQIYSGARYRQPYQILIGVIWIPFGIWVIIAHAGIPITVLMFGSVMVVSGGIKFCRFLNSHRVLTELEA